VITVAVTSTPVQRIRRAEWLLALACTALGIVYLLRPGLMTEAYFTTMLALAPQHVWGWGALAVGLVRVVFLIVNGHWRASPHLRMIGAGICVVFWSALFLTALTSQLMVQAVAFWPLFALADFLATLDAAADARAADDEARAKKGEAANGSGSH
jgi:hypothetical protein